MVVLFGDRSENELFIRLGTEGRVFWAAVWITGNFGTGAAWLTFCKLALVTPEVVSP